MKLIQNYKKKKINSYRQFLKTFKCELKLTESLKENRVVGLAEYYSDYRFLDQTKEGRSNLTFFYCRIIAKISKNKHKRLTFLMSEIKKK